MAIITVSNDDKKWGESQVLQIEIREKLEHQNGGPENGFENAGDDGSETNCALKKIKKSADDSQTIKGVVVMSVAMFFFDNYFFMTTV